MNPTHKSMNPTHLSSISSPVAPPYVPGTWSYDRCVGSLQVSGFAKSQYALSRNTGGGSAACCSMHPQAGPARSSGSSLQAALMPKEDAKDTRNGARVYLNDQCHDGLPLPESYAGVQLLGRTLSVTVNLAGASCGCNVAFYLAFLRDSTTPGLCESDFYCDA